MYKILYPPHPIKKRNEYCKNVLCRYKATFKARLVIKGRINKTVKRIGVIRGNETRFSLEKSAFCLWRSFAFPLVTDGATNPPSNGQIGFSLFKSFPLQEYAMSGNVIILVEHTPPPSTNVVS
jgi:hypothetical protein